MRLTWMATTIGGANAEVGYIATRRLFDEPTDPPRCDIQRIVVGQLGFMVDIDPESFAPEVLDELEDQCARHEFALDADEVEQREFILDHGGQA